ncbi:acyl-CoA dehydrogenase [Desulfotomaculum sp. 1211_IL3151]|uniref:acyl-CoA dehydrogenase n=1 Tax=Desulfotomaculum sp. 1211_IL3151 TaxID=3084055 RepID=UPI002FD9E8CF
MDFRLNDEQQMFRDTIRKFAQKEIAPIAAQTDHTHQFPLDTIKKLADMGLMGLPIPEEYGGAGSDYVTFAILVEEIAKVCASTAVVLSVHTGLGCMSTYMFGNDEQKERYLKPLCEGTMLGAFALTEPQAGSDAAALKCTAVRKGDKYIVNGSKIFITNGGYADMYVTFVRTDPTTKNYNGVTCLIIDKDTPGLIIGKPEEKMGLNGSATVTLTFEDAEVPVENRLLEEGKGFNVAMGLLNGGRITIGAQGLGIAQGAMDLTIPYVKTREQFGKPLSAQQGIQFMLADMQTEIDASRLLVYRAAWLKSNGLEHAMEASMAKKFATDTAMRVTTDCVQLFGGYGYCKEYQIERYMRDAKITQIYEGANQVQRIVIAKNLLK